MFVANVIILIQMVWDILKPVKTLTVALIKIAVLIQRKDYGFAI